MIVKVWPLIRLAFRLPLQNTAALFTKASFSILEIHAKPLIPTINILAKAYFLVIENLAKVLYYLKRIRKTHAVP